MSSNARSSGDRQVVVDRLRGFALLGVLLVNTPYLITSVDGMTDASMPGWFDRVAGFLTWTLFQAKSYVIFSFLFGYSLTILLEKVDGRGLDGGRVYRQRLIALSLFGVAHAVLLFVGDILVLYAVLGSALLWLRKKPDRTLLRLAGALFGVQAVMFGLMALVPAEDLASPAWIDRSWAVDGLLGATWTRVQIWPVAFTFVLVLQGLLVAALFCVGLVAGRHRLLADPEAGRPWLLRLRRWGYLVGLPPQVLAGLLGVWPGIDDAPGRQMLALALMYLTAPVLSAAFVATIALLPRRGLAKAVEADGAMSLSIYLGESLAMTTLAAGWGWGLFGLSTGAAFVVAIAVWLGLLLFANIWHRRWGTGPAERLLRRMTYAGMPRSAAAPTSVVPVATTTR